MAVVICTNSPCKLVEALVIAAAGVVAARVDHFRLLVDGSLYL